MKTRKNSIVRLTTMLAGSIAIAVSVMVPAGYFLVSYQYILGTLDSQAEINARTVTHLVMANPEMWRYEEVRLMELLERRGRGNIPERRRILDPQGGVVAESADPLWRPAVSRHHNIYDAGTPVAQIEITRSLAPLLLETALVAAGAMLLGGLVFLFCALSP